MIWRAQCRLNALWLRGCELFTTEDTGFHRGSSLTYAVQCGQHMILDALHRLANPAVAEQSQSLSRDEARAVMSDVLAGKCTDAQIAAQLYITVRTVSSHLDRIRDKTGCRRRADLTRLALGAGLV